MKIALDFHSVCADFESVWLAYLNDLKGTSYKPSDVTEWKVWEVLGCTKSEFWDCVNAATRQPGNAFLQPVGGACSAIRCLVAQGHDVSIVSATTDPNGIHRWLRYNGLPALPVVQRDPEVPDKFALNFDIFVDDNPEMCNGVRGNQTFVLFAQPWNACVELGPRDTRVAHWGSVLNIIDELTNAEADK